MKILDIEKRTVLDAALKFEQKNVANIIRSKISKYESNQTIEMDLD